MAQGAALPRLRLRLRLRTSLRHPGARPLCDRLLTAHRPATLAPSHRPGRPRPEDQPSPPGRRPSTVGPGSHRPVLNLNLGSDPATDQPQPPPGKARHCPAEVEVKVKDQAASPRGTAALRPPPDGTPTGNARPKPPPRQTPPRRPTLAPRQETVYGRSRKPSPGPQPQPRRDPAKDQPQPPPGKARHCPAEVEVKVKDQAASPRGTAALRPPPDGTPTGNARPKPPPRKTPPRRPSLAPGIAAFRENRRQTTATQWRGYTV